MEKEEDEHGNCTRLSSAKWSFLIGLFQLISLSHGCLVIKSSNYIWESSGIITGNISKNSAAPSKTISMTRAIVCSLLYESFFLFFSFRSHFIVNSFLNWFEMKNRTVSWKKNWQFMRPKFQKPPPTRKKKKKKQLSLSSTWKFILAEEIWCFHNFFFCLESSMQ